jgi:hypothetical protein
MINDTGIRYWTWRSPQYLERQPQQQKTLLDLGRILILDITFPSVTYIALMVFDVG